MSQTNTRKALGKGLEQLFNSEMDFNTFEKDIVENTKKSDVVDIKNIKCSIVIECSTECKIANPENIPKNIQKNISFIFKVSLKIIAIFINNNPPKIFPICKKPG